MSGEDKVFNISSKDQLVATLTRLHRRIAALEGQAEGEGLPTSEDQLNSIVGGVPDIVYQLDESGTIVFINQAIDQYGYEPEELVGRNIFDLIHPDDRQKALYRINERRTGERSTRSLELRLLTKNQERSIPFEFKSSTGAVEATGAATLLIDAEGIYADEASQSRQFLYTQGVARDITERHKQDAFQRRLRQELEQRVAERTADLQAANMQLYREVAERKRSADALRQSEERYRLLVELSPDAIFILRGGCIVFANAEGLEFLGAPGPEQILERPLDEFLKPLDDPAASAAGARQRRRRYRRPDGRRLDAEVRTVPFVYLQDPAVLMVARDITAHSQLERRLEAALRLRDEVWSLGGLDDLGGVVLELHAALVQLDIDCAGCGLNVPQERGETVRSWRCRRGEKATAAEGPDPLALQIWRAEIPFLRPDLHTEDSYREREAVAAAWGPQIRTVLDVPFASGTVTLASARPHAFTEKDIEAVEALALALGETMGRLEDRRQLDLRTVEAEDTAAALKKALEREEAVGRIRDRIIAMRRIADLPAEDFWVEELRHLGVHIGGMSLQFPGSQPDQYVTFSFDRHAFSEDTPLDRFPWIRQVWESGEKVLVDRDRLEELGHTDWKIQSILEVPLPGGGSLGINAADCSAFDEEALRAVDLVAGLLAEGLKRVRDFESLDQRENQLRQVQKMEAIGQLTAGIAHNFNNILQGIMGNLHLALREAPKSLEEVLQDAEKGSRRAADMVQQLMVFARQGMRPAYRSLDLQALVQDTLEICRQTFDKKIVLDATLPEGRLGLEGDVGQLQQVLLNLFLNARDAIEEADPSTPRIHLKVERLHLDEDRVPVDPIEGAEPTPYLRLEIADNGIGMDETVRQRVFDPFFTTKEVDKGTGLGLSTVYGIVHQHRGWVECDSTPGKGSAFVVFLPAVPQVVAEDAPVSAGVEPPSDEVPRGDETILVIDDEEIVRASTCKLLQKCGYTVETAADGPAGLAIYKRRADDIDLVVLDLSMPTMSGAEVLKKLRAIRTDVRVMIFTGYGADRNDLGPVAGWIQKPFLLDALARQVRQALDS